MNDQIMEIARDEQPAGSAPADGAMMPNCGGAGELSYAEALERVMGLADFERSTHSPEHATFHLERVSRVLDLLGRPHLGTPTVHIAGTKGKGSTAAMVTSVLAAAGYTVGLYTSPHLHSAVERIRVGLEPIERREFASLVQRIWPVVQRVSEEGGRGGVTTFEMLTAMAFLHFRDIHADFQVIEVGLGGRLDSTNVVQPDVCAITSISLDHEATLGDTIRRIAFEKAGIIKPGVPVVVAPQPAEALAVFRELSAQRRAPMVELHRDVAWLNGHKGRGSFGYQEFSVKGVRGEYDLSMPLLGAHQLENAGGALAVIEILIGKGFPISKESIVAGFQGVRWPARLEVLSSEGKLVLVDGAHNQYSMGRLVEALRDHFTWRRAMVVFGALRGHSPSRMLVELKGLAPTMVATRSRHPRAVPGDAIVTAASEQGLAVLAHTESVAEAMRTALEAAGDGDMVLGTGSLSVAAEMIEEARGIPPELYPIIKRPLPWK